jgi:glycosyltransferase involved in cell wall biosynthesis
MKVLFIHCVYQFKGGEDTVVIEELKLLQESGVETKLLEFNNKKNALLSVLQLPYNVSSYQKTLRTLRSFKPDVVHVHNVHFAASPSVLFAVKKQKIPLVMTLHNFRLLCPSAMLCFKGKPFMYSLHQNFPWKATRLGVYKNSVFLTFWMSVAMQIHHWFKVWDKPDRYILLSEHAKRIFEESKLHYISPKTVVKPNFCYPMPPLNLSRSTCFLYIGRLTVEKGIFVMLKAFAQTGLNLKIGGDGPLRNEVIDFCVQHTNISFLGSLRKQEVFTQLADCTALIFPSIWYEGMPLIIIEAFACGTPVIASKIGVMENMITHCTNGLHFKAGNVHDLAAKLQEWEILSEADQAVYSQNAMRTYTQYYTPEKNKEQLLGLYHDLVQQQQLSNASPSAAFSVKKALP